MSEQTDTSNNEPVNLRPIYFNPRHLIFHIHRNLKEYPNQALELIKWANELAPNGIKLSDTETDDILNFEPTGTPGSTHKSSHYERRESILKELAGKTDYKSRYKTPPLKDNLPFSLFFAKVEREGLPEISLDSSKQESEEEAKIQKKLLEELLDFVIKLNERCKEAPGPLKLEAVSPNWLMSGSREDPGSTGGPGGRPFPVDDKKKNDYKFSLNLNNFSEPSGLFKGILDGNPGDGVVDVAILDTSYSTNELEDILREWVPDGQDNPHPIIKALLSKDPEHFGALRDAGGTLRVHMNPALPDYPSKLKIDGHDYEMKDHGLFVAGIINTIAPNAKLHMYQVLNRYGLGDLRGIAHALYQVFNDFQDNDSKEIRLLVNLSLTMNVPLDKGHLNARDILGVGQVILDHIESNKLSLSIFEWIFDLIYTLDSRVIAAAGNQSKSRDARPGALYPAASDRVLGVGALKYDDGSLVPASYSNLADKPPKMGITTFGGESGAEKGILGVYVGPFPDGSDNENGMAWWSGTSFATPIISGITAAVLSKMPGEITEQAILRVFEAQIKFTGDEEDSFTVVQGPP